MQVNVADYLLETDRRQCIGDETFNSVIEILVSVTKSTGSVVLQTAIDIMERLLVSFERKNEPVSPARANVRRSFLMCSMN